MKKSINFYEKRNIFLLISFLVIMTGFAALYLNGVKLDIQFKGGSIVKYRIEEGVQTPAAEFENAASAAMSRDVTVQVSSDTATGKEHLVISFVGNEGLSPQQQEELNVALHAAFPEHAFEIHETLVVEPFMGRTFLMNGIRAIILSFVLIALYVWIRFKRLGLAAGVIGVLALMHDALLVFFVFVILKMPLNENFIAVMLTLIGYSINDTIVIYDRIRENLVLDSKKPVGEIVDKSITQSLPRSINTNLTMFIVLIILYGFAVNYQLGSIVTFALPMAIGTIICAYTSIFITGPFWAAWKKFRSSKVA